MTHRDGSAEMSTTTQHGAPEHPVKASGHLSIRPDGDGPREVRFYLEEQGSRIGGALGAAVLSHAAIIGLILLVGALLPERVYEAVIPDRLSDQIVWLSQPGPGGGGGGGGNRTPEPPKPAELPGREKITVPAVKPPAPTPEPPKPEEPKPEEPINIPAQTMAAATQTAPGAIESTQASTSQGVGTGGGAGTGTGTGIGQGQGTGLGAGFGGGTGGGAYRPGNGVQLPRVIREVKPQYTAEAMRAKVQGSVTLECVVLPDGSVGSVEVVRSLDSTFGLDQEAIKAAKQWRFAPGTRLGEPVAVLVTIELTFTLR